jgi:cytochrome c peroxidase
MLLPGYAAVFTALLSTLLAGCGGEAPATTVAPPPGTPAVSLSGQLSARIAELGLKGDPAEGLSAVRPEEDPAAALGMQLFFSRSLSLTFDTACATCHHPRFAGGDALPLSIGVSADEPFVIGPARLHVPARDDDPNADGGPDVPRNSQTIYNAALYSKSLFWDGRVALLDDGRPGPGGRPPIRTPDSGNSADPQAGNNLLGAQARFPVTSGTEMRGFGHGELPGGEDVRNRLVQRLRGETDADRIRPEEHLEWLRLFRTAFGHEGSTAAEVITYPNIQEALSAYQRGQLFVDTAWNRYLRGDKRALTPEAIEGALLFFTDVGEGGLGCHACHAGDRLTDEAFYNTGFPQIGRGKRPDGRDFGRYDVSHREEDRYAFRVPSLINVALTGPWGHDGAFRDLAALLDYHVDPEREIDRFLAGFDPGTFLAPLEVQYPNVGTYTREAIAAPGFAGGKLPRRALSGRERDALLAFLLAQGDAQLESYVLTGTCASALDPCPDEWLPEIANDPDGNMLVPGQPSVDEGLPVDPGETAPDSALFAIPFLGPQATFADLSGCSGPRATRANTGERRFIERAGELGITHRHGFDHGTWMSRSGFWFESLMMHAGVSAAFVDGDCWPDLVFPAGDWGGLAAYRNDAGAGFVAEDWFDALLLEAHPVVSTLVFADLDGDYRREAIAGSIMGMNAAVLAQDGAGSYAIASGLIPSSRNIYGIAVGDYDRDGYQDFYLAHWGVGGLPGTAPVLWRNNAGGSVSAADNSTGLASSFGINQFLQFSPGFMDLDEDGWLDLLIAGDFGTSLVMMNEPHTASGRRFADVTDRDVITDENGMGAAFGDFDNDGDQDWFVSSIHDPNGFAEGAWGLTGNRLYRNDAGTLVDVTANAGVADGRWGWGSCFADFDNDGWLDIFHENGHGFLPEEIRDWDTGFRIDGYKVMAAEFIDTPPRLFMSNRDGTFREEALAWGLSPANGRGIVCADMDRDGDVDIVVAGNSVAPRYYENQSGFAQNFASFRLEGLPPNTDALGTRVRVAADLNGNGTVQDGETQLRVQEMNPAYESQTPPVMHFGLGEEALALGVEVTWPDGSELSCSMLAANRHYVISQRTGTCQ